MWAEIRVSWLTLFLLTASGAAHQYATYGTVSTPMIFMLVAHFLYANACMKGEECIPTTWDIFHEKWGGMLVFWNLAGVPFVYCFGAMYLASQPPFEHSVPYTLSASRSSSAPTTCGTRRTASAIASACRSTART